MKNLTIGKRITLGFTVILAITALLGGSSWYQSIKVAAYVETLTDDSIPGIELASDLAIQTLDYRVINLKHVVSTNEAEMIDLDKLADARAQSILAVLAKYRATIVDPAEKQIADEIEPALAAFRDAAKQMRKLSMEQKADEAAALMNGAVSKAYVAFEESVMAAKDFNLNTAETTSGLAMAALASSQKTTVIVLGAALLIGALFAYFISRSIGRVLTAISSILADGANNVAAASSQVSSSSQALAEGASEQAASLEETSSSLEEMTSMTKRNANNAASAKETAVQTRQSADNGAEQMKTLVAAMDSIKTASEDITKILKNIDEIAFQTNILALNAAVEAARAGEAGAGFAVVADEVRSLAQRCATAAKETAEKIDDSVKKSLQGVVISTDVARSFDEIQTKIRTLDQLVAEIASASNEQSQGISQVNIAVTEMDKVTQTTAASAEECASASEELNAQAEALKDAVADLQRLVTGDSAVPNSGRPTPAARPANTRNTFASGGRSMSPKAGQNVPLGQRGGSEPITITSRSGSKDAEMTFENF